MMRTIGMRLASSALALLTPETQREEILGDLAEEFALRSKSSSTSAATGWYYRQIVRSLPPLAWARIAKGTWLATLGTALGAYVALGIVEYALNLTMMRVFTLPAAAVDALTLIFGFPLLILLGFGVSRVRPSAATTLAAIMAIVAIAVMSNTTEDVTLTYKITFVILGPLGVVLGSKFHSSRNAKS
jgi:hypothetical protein